MTTKIYRRVARTDGGLKSTYIGALSDPLVQFLKRRDTLDAAELSAQKRQHDADRDMLAKIDYVLDTEQKQIEAALRAWLRTQSKSIARDGSWHTKTLRKSRSETVPMNMSKDDFHELLALAEHGNETALGTLRSIMAKDRDTWFPFGDLQAHSRSVLIDSLTRGNTVARESLNINLQEMREELLGEISNPIRSHAVEHVVTCWVDVQRQLMMAAESSHSRGAADFNDRRLDRAQKRYLKSLDFLNNLNVQLGVEQTLPEAEVVGADADN